MKVVLGLCLVLLSSVAFAAKKQQPEPTVVCIWSLLEKPASVESDHVAVVMSDGQVKLYEHGQYSMTISEDQLKQALAAQNGTSKQQTVYFFNNLQGQAEQARARFLGTFRGNYAPTGTGKALGEIVIAQEGCWMDGVQKACPISLDWENTTIQLTFPSGGTYTYDIKRGDKVLQLSEHVFVDGKPARMHYYFVERLALWRRLWDAL